MTRRPRCACCGSESAPVSLPGRLRACRECLISGEARRLLACIREGAWL